MGQSKKREDQTKTKSRFHTPDNVINLLSRGWQIRIRRQMPLSFHVPEKSLGFSRCTKGRTNVSGEGSSLDESRHSGEVLVMIQLTMPHSRACSVERHAILFFYVAMGSSRKRGRADRFTPRTTEYAVKKCNAYSIDCCACFHRQQILHCPQCIFLQ